MSAALLARTGELELMRRVQTDDTEAFGVLYDRLAPRAFRVAQAVGVRRDRAEEAVQDAFLSVWRNRAAYRAECGEVHSWALGIVRHRAIDALRRNQRHHRVRQDFDGAAEGHAAPGDVENDTAALDEARRLRTMLVQLPLAQREVIALAYFGELTHNEIADALSLPLGTVKGRMRLGLEKLRDQIIAEPAPSSPLSTD